MEQDHIQTSTNNAPDAPEKALPATQPPGHIQRAVKTLSQRTKALLSPWSQRRVDNLRARIQGDAETVRPLTMTHRNTHRLLHRVQQTREHSVVWKPDIGALKPALVERFNSAITHRAQTLHLIGIRRQAAVPATAWESNLELTLPVGSASQVGQVIERIPPAGLPKGPSIFTAGQPIEPFKPAATPAQSPRSAASSKPKHKPAPKQLPPQARLYARVEEISPYGEVQNQEMRPPSPLTAPAMPQPAVEKPEAQPTGPQSMPLPEVAALPPMAAPPVIQNQRQIENARGTELPPAPASQEIPRVTPRRPRPTTPQPPVQRVVVPDVVSTPQKPAPSESLSPEAQSPRPVTETPPLTKQPTSAARVTPPTTQPVAAQVIQRAVEAASPRVEQSRPQPAVEAPPVAVKPDTFTKAEPHLPRAIAKPSAKQPTQAQPPRALPIEPPKTTAEPVRRVVAPAIPRAVAKPETPHRIESLTAPQVLQRAATPTEQPTTAPQPSRRPVPSRTVTPDFPRHVEVQRATEPTPVQRQTQTAPSPARAETQPPSPVTTPQESRQTDIVPTIDFVAFATLATQPAKSIQTASAQTPILNPPSPISHLPSPISKLPLRQAVQRRADSRSRGLLHAPASPPTLRPITRIQPPGEAGGSKPEVRNTVMYAHPTPDEARPSLPASTSPTLYTRGSNLYVGPGPAPTVIRTGALSRTQKLDQEGKPTSQPPMDLRTVMNTLPTQASSRPTTFSSQTSDVGFQPSPPSLQPSTGNGNREYRERPAEMPLVRQHAAQQPHTRVQSESVRTAEPVSPPTIVGELIQREDAGQSASEESEASEVIDLGELAHKVYPFVKRLIAIERERMAR